VKGWKSSASWSFPRGKRSKDEEDHTCAVREVNFWAESMLFFAVLSIKLDL
jgi:predicted NUDIX family NTP pyrophosphohydrolase